MSQTCVDCPGLILLPIGGEGRASTHASKPRHDSVFPSTLVSMTWSSCLVGEKHQVQSSDSTLPPRLPSMMVSPRTLTSKDVDLNLTSTSFLPLAGGSNAMRMCTSSPF